MNASKKPEERTCAACGQIIVGGLLQCPKCGGGVFETEKTPKESVIINMGKSLSMPEQTHIDMRDMDASHPLFERLVDELIRIGRNVEDPTYCSTGYLRRRETAEASRNPRAREIGKQLHTMGGFGMMSRASRRVEDTLGPLAATELSHTWHEVGDWLA